MVTIRRMCQFVHGGGVPGVVTIRRMCQFVHGGGVPGVVTIRRMCQFVHGDAGLVRPGYLSTSPTTKNIEPRTATMSATRQPGSTSVSTWTLPNDAERSFRRHGVFSPRDTR